MREPLDFLEGCLLCDLEVPEQELDLENFLPFLLPFLNEKDFLLMTFLTELLSLHSLAWLLYEEALDALWELNLHESLPLS